MAMLPRIKTTKVGTRGRDGRKVFRWTVEFEVSETWVADGFDLDDERAFAMIAHDLGYAGETEIGARVVAAPPASALHLARMF